MSERLAETAGDEIVSEEKHKERHVLLHKCLDELLADYLRHHSGALLSETSIFQLTDWSLEQTRNPTPNP